MEKEYWCHVNQYQNLQKKRTGEPTVLLKIKFFYLSTIVTSFEQKKGVESRKFSHYSMYDHYHVLSYTMCTSISHAPLV